MADPVSDPVEKPPGSDPPEQTVKLASLLFRKHTSANATMLILVRLLACLGTVLVRWNTS